MDEGRLTIWSPARRYQLACSATCADVKAVSEHLTGRTTSRSSSIERRPLGRIGSRFCFTKLSIYIKFLAVALYKPEGKNCSSVNFAIIHVDWHRAMLDLQQHPSALDNRAWQAAFIAGVL